MQPFQLIPLSDKIVELSTNIDAKLEILESKDKENIQFKITAIAEKEANDVRTVLLNTLKEVVGVRPAISGKERNEKYPTQKEVTLRSHFKNMDEAEKLIKALSEKKIICQLSEEFAHELFNAERPVAKVNSVENKGITNPGSERCPE